MKCLAFETLSSILSDSSVFVHKHAHIGEGLLEIDLQESNRVWGENY